MLCYFYIPRSRIVEMLNKAQLSYEEVLCSGCIKNYSSIFATVVSDYDVPFIRASPALVQCRLERLSS